MSLYSIWKEDPSQIRDKRVDQIIGFAGDGNLGDKNTAPAEFRAFLARIPSDMLESYALDCLTTSFRDSGLALQDIVNEIAHRLGFEVEPGRYRGTQKEIGHDGIWRAPDGHVIVAEVKTTDAYRLPIETVANYRRRLMKAERLIDEASSILVIVGREDTGELEAQIRGSRHAWDVRLISIDALIRLMKIRQELDDPGAEARIRSLLVPHEYTRVDEIIDLVFSTTEDILEEGAEEAQRDDAEAERNGEKKKRETPVSFNSACAERISEQLGVDLNKRSRITFADLDANVIVTCSVSKEYNDPKGSGYWFAFHPHQLEKLQQAGSAFASFGCGSPDQIALLPLDFLEGELEGMNQTERENGDRYWHIQISKEGDRWLLRKRKGEVWPEISDKMLLRQ